MTMHAAPSRLRQDQGAGRSEEHAAVHRAALHLIWFLVLLYLLNNIDRTNVGFATLTMNKDLGLSAQTFGVAVGIFYLGYLFCEIPSNIILAKTGARRSLARMAISSGLVTMLTAFVQGPVSFYIVRFLLGVAEAGYLVGIMWSIATRVHADRDVIMIPNIKVWGLDNASPIIRGEEAFQRLGTKWMIDATKPAVTMPVQRARFDKATPPNVDSIDLADFLP